MLIKDLIREANQILRCDNRIPITDRSGAEIPSWRDNPTIEVISLVAHGLGIDKSTLYMRYNDKVDNSQVATVSGLINRRAKSEPLEYITGKVNFMGLEFCVSPPVFIPRPETEVLVEQAIKMAKLLTFNSKLLTIFDICTGSGVIGITIAKFLPQVFVYASDIMDLKLAKLNATKHGVGNRISFLRGNLLTPFRNQNSEIRGQKSEIRSQNKLNEPWSEAETPPWRGNEPNDTNEQLKTNYQKPTIIVSNPPYIPTAQIQTLQPEIKLFEPYEALDGGEDGMLFIRLLIREAPEYLNPNGTLILEISPEQKADVIEEANKYFEDVKIVNDFCNYPRLLIASTPL